MQADSQHHLGPSIFSTGHDKHHKTERIQELENQVSSLKIQLAGYTHTQEALAQELLALRKDMADEQTHRTTLEKANQHALHDLTGDIRHLTEDQRSSHYEFREGLKRMESTQNQFQRDLSEVELVHNEVRDYMQAFPSKRLEDMARRVQTNERDIRALTTSVQKLEHS